MIIRPDLRAFGFENNKAYGFETKENHIQSVVENFEFRRNYSTESRRVRIGLGENWVHVNIIMQEYSNPLHEIKNLRQIHVPIDVEFDRGLYVHDLEFDEYWLIFSDKRNIEGAYWSSQVRKCDYLMKWIDTVTRKIVSCWAVMTPKNSYSSGIWWNTFGGYVDDESACVIPSGLIEVSRIRRYDRRIISNNLINIKTFSVSNINDVIMEGATIVNFEEDNYNEEFDDKHSRIADRWKLELEFKIDVISASDDVVNIALNDVAMIRANVMGYNKLFDETNKIENATLKFKTCDTTIVNVDESGIIKALSIGETEIIIEYFDIDDEFVCEKIVNVNIVENLKIEYKVVLTGNKNIYFNAKSKYTAVLLENGISSEDTFTFELLTIDDKPLNEKFATLISSNNECIILAKDYQMLIKLKVISNSTNISNFKVITLKDII